MTKEIGKREFIQNTSKYIGWVEEHGTPLIITHHRHPTLILSKAKYKSIKDLKGTVDIEIHGDINEPVLLGFEKW